MIALFIKPLILALAVLTHGFSLDGDDGYNPDLDNPDDPPGLEEDILKGVPFPGEAPLPGI